ncbi:MAG: type II secretion system protein C [bacterium]|jgi:type II secretion system protein C
MLAVRYSPPLESEVGFLKRAAPWIIVGVLTLLVALTAFGVNSVIRRQLALPDDAEPVNIVVADTPDVPDGVQPDRAPVIKSKRQYIDGILVRNIFDASAIGRAAEVTDAATMLADLNLSLIGTLVAVPSRYSAAYITQTGDDPETLSYGIEDTIEDATIVEIGVDSVTLRRSDDSVEMLTMGEDAPAATPAPRPSSGDSDEEGVEKVDDNNYVIDRELVDRYLTDLDAIGRLGRAIPHRGSDGEIDGYRLSGVRRRSIGDKIGIKNGDIVHSVNGASLDSMQGAMAAYQTLQSENRFTFEVTRRGQRQTMSYEVK